MEPHIGLALEAGRHTGPVLEEHTVAVARGPVAAAVVGYIAVIVNTLLALEVESCLGRLDSFVGERR